MTYLLDTNVVSELRKQRPDPDVAAWLNSVVSDELFLSVLTLGEIRQGIERLRRKDVDQADVLDKWLAGLRSTYADRIVNIEQWIGTPAERQPLPRT